MLRLVKKEMAFTSDNGDILLAEVKYKEMENQKENADIFNGQSTKKFLCDNTEQLNVGNFYLVRNYYMAACSFIIKKYPYDNELLINASVIDIDKRAGAFFSSLTFSSQSGFLSDCLSMLTLMLFVGNFFSIRWSSFRMS